MLIFNGLEHGKSPVDVWCTPGEEADDPDHRYCCFHVKDAGEGIPTQNDDSIYMAGYTSRPDDQHGMGLYICCYLARLLEGKLDHVSGDKGAHFRLYLRELL